MHPKYGMIVTVLCIVIFFRQPFPQLRIMLRLPHAAITMIPHKSMNDFLIRRVEIKKFNPGSTELLNIYRLLCDVESDIQEYISKSVLFILTYGIMLCVA